MASIEELLAQLGAMNYQAPSSYKGYQSGLPSQGIGYKNLGGSDEWNFTQDTFKSTKKEDKKKSSNWKPDLWGVLAGTLGQVGGAVTDQAYNVIDAYKRFGDGKDSVGSDLLNLFNKMNPASTVTRGAINGGKKQWENWKDGKLSWGDVPGIGFLDGMEEGWKRGSDIIEDHAGVKNKWGRVGGGIAIDIALDPLTYLTGGAAAATKLAKAKEVSKLADMSKVMKVAGKFKNSDEFAEAAKLSLRQKYPNMSQSIIDKRVAKAVDEVKVARNQVYNQNINRWGFSVPFSNKLTTTVGDIRKGSVLHRTEATLGTEFKHLADDLINSVAKTPAAKNAVLQKIESLYGVNKVEDLTKTMYNDLYKRLTPVIEKLGKGLPDAVIKPTNTPDFIPPDISGDINKLTKFMDKSDDVKAADGMVDLGAYGTWGKAANADEVAPEFGDAIANTDDVMKLLNSKTRKLKPKNAPVKQTDEVEEVGLEDLLSEMGQGIADYINKSKGLVDDIPAKFGDDIDSAKFLKGADLEIDDVMKMLDELPTQAKGVPDGADLGVFGRWGTADPLSGMKIPKVTSPQRTVDKATVNFKNQAEIFPNGQPASVAMKDRKALSDAMSGQYGEMGNFKTGFEHWLDRKNPFDARTLQTGNKFVDSMADHIADMNSYKIGDNARYQMGLAAIEKFVKKNKITEDEMMEAIYHLEGRAPEHFGAGWEASERAKKLADKIKPILDDVASKEQSAGVLDKTRKNYFPHIIQKSQEELEKIKAFKAQNGSLDGLSQVNKNSKSRTGFETMAERDDYIMKLEKAIQKETDPDKIAEYRQQLEDVAQLFDTNVVSALTRRIKEGVRSKAAKEMQGELKKYGMYAKDPEDISRTFNMQKLTPDEARKLGLGEGTHYMNKDVFKGLKRIDEIFTDQGMNKTVRHLNAFSDAWRSLVTHYKPSHYVNNMIGNVINNMAAGVRATDYKAANKLIMGYRNGKLTPAQMKLMEQAYKKNVISGGFISDIKHGFQFDNTLGSEKLADKITDSKYAKTMRHYGEIGDDISRLANYLNGIHKYGGDVEKAAQQTRMYLFNYNELTNADRAMRVAVPFWNWTKRNIPLQMKLLLENPKVAMNVERFKNLFNEEEPGADWQKKMGIKIPTTDRYMGIPSPTNDLNTLLNPLSLLGSMNPAAKMGIEIMQNKKMLNGQPITYGQNEVAPEDLPGYFAKNFGVTGNVYDAATGKRSILESLAHYMFPTYKIPENEKE